MTRWEGKKDFQLKINFELLMLRRIRAEVYGRVPGAPFLALFMREKWGL